MSHDTTSIAKRTFMAALAIVIAGPALADTNHWYDTVTFIKPSYAYPSCIKFQTLGTGGVYGIDNSSGGDSSATGFTGSAQVNAIGVGTGTGSMGAVAALVAAQMQASETAKAPIFSWADAGTNSASIYADCPTTVNAAKTLGQ